MKRQKSLLLRLLTIVTITILAPSILTFLVFFRTVPERMETQAQANVGFYIDQTNASVKNSMELAREVAFSALGDPMLQKNMQRTEFYLSSMGRGALEQMVGSVTAYQSAWSRNVLSVFIFFGTTVSTPSIPPREPMRRNNAAWRTSVTRVGNCPRPKRCFRFPVRRRIWCIFCWIIKTLTPWRT